MDIFFGPYCSNVVGPLICITAPANSESLGQLVKQPKPKGGQNRQRSPFPFPNSGNAFNSPDGHDVRQHGHGVPGRQLGNGEDAEGEQKVDEVEAGQTDQQLVEVAAHLRTGQHEDGEDVAWMEIECDV